MNRRPRKRAHRKSDSLAWRIGVAVVLTTVVAIWRRYRNPGDRLAPSINHEGFAMNAQVPPAEPGDADGDDREREEFMSYVWGIGLALLLTLAAFGLVHFGDAPRVTVYYVIGALALVQMIVHFRFFLHIGFQHQREDLQLILFSALLLIIMVGGTVWIMASLAHRMAMP